MLTLSANLARTARLFGDRPAIVDTETDFCWAEFVDRARRAAAALLALGLEPGARFAVLCRNSFRNAELMHGGYWAGLVPVPVNYRLAPPEIAYILGNAEVGLVAIEDQFAHLLGAADLEPWADRGLLIASSETGSPWPQYEPLVAGAEPAPMHEAGEDDDALLVYTGGTTGRAKGVRLSHRNIMINALQIAFVARPRRDDICLHVAPMFHSADLLNTPWVIAGAAHLYMPKFEPAAVFEAIQEYRVTCAVLTPTMLVMLLQDPGFGHYDLSSLRQIIYGSSPMAAEWILRSLESLPGVEFIQAYGLTETAPLLTMLGMAEHRQALRTGDTALLKSVGRALPGVEMRIVDDEGREAPEGAAGEIAVRAPNASKGYLRRPEATAESFRGDWFYTGDVGRLDQRGYLYLLDRKKDLIITGGELVYSLEVEAALYENPEIQECAVVGVPDETYGEALLAAIVPAPGAAPTPEGLIAHLRGRIGGYKIPRRFVFIDKLPKSAMNKVLKHELRRIYGEVAKEAPAS